MLVHIRMHTYSTCLHSTDIKTQIHTHTCLLESKELLVESCNTRQQHENGLLNERITTVLVLENQTTNFIKVSHHELSTHTTRKELVLYSLASSKALSKPREPSNGGSSTWERCL